MWRSVARDRKAMEGALKQDSKISAGITDAEEATECSSPPCLMREVNPAYFWFTPENPSEENTSTDAASPSDKPDRDDEGSAR